jgi:WD40 repeat protein
VAFTADGRLLATGGGSEAKVNLWDAATFALRQSLDLGPAEDLAFAPHDLLLAIAGRDGCVRLCRPDLNGSWKLTKTFRAHNDVIHHVAWSPDGKRLATGGQDNAIKLWDTISWRKLATFGPLQDAALCVNFSPDGRQLTAAVRNEPLKVWDIDEPQSPTEMVGYTALMTTFFSPDGWRIVSAGEDGTVRLWNAAQAADHDRLEGHIGQVRTIALSRVGNVLASGGADGAIILWNLATCQPLRVLRSRSGTIRDLAFSPDGSRLAAAEWEGHLRIWQVDSGIQVLDLPLNIGPLVGVEWAPDKSQLAIQAVDGSIRLVEASSGRQLASWTSAKGPQGGIAFSPDSRFLAAAGGDSSVRVWNVATHALVHELVGHTAPAVNVAFSSIGTIIASSSTDHTIRLWDAITGRELRTLTGHSGTAPGLAFSPDGTRLASSGTDKTVKIWDVATGLELQSLAGHLDWVRDVAFSPDGQHLASAGYDGTVRIWHAPFVSAPRPGEGLGQGAIADWSTAREATALINQLATCFSTRDSLVAAIESDQTISANVRAAAIQQAGQYLFCWPPMLAGHRAAQRRDWPAAADAFDRVATLAPQDVMHWYWRAMANLAADRQEVYRRVCIEMLDRFGGSANDNDCEWITMAWLVSSHENKDLARLRPLVDTYERYSPQLHYLYELRIGKAPSAFQGSSRPPATLGLQPEDWYILSMVWLKLGNEAQARAAYETGARQARSGIYHWDTEVFRETLQSEVERLLGDQPATRSETLERATDAPASTSDARPAGESATPAQPAAPN